MPQQFDLLELHWNPLLIKVSTSKPGQLDIYISISPSLFLSPSRSNETVRISLNILIYIYGFPRDMDHFISRLIKCIMC
ncbi:hypothetical protein Scep_012378 [Stephania cephalantha]|uniref:Uncharacterized protein n=1 Tax=Stephania cephalantha TaxID=152367 RepID=A0AAP0P9H0_9MAGN